MIATIVLLLSFLSSFLLWKYIVAERNLIVCQRKRRPFIYRPSSVAFAGLLQTSWCILDVIQLSPGTKDLGGERVARTHAGAWSVSVVSTTGTSGFEGFVWWASVYGSKILSLTPKWALWVIIFLVSWWFYLSPMYLL